MNIVCSTDKRYVMPTGVMLTSLLINNNDEDIHVHLLYDELPIQDISDLRHCVESYGKRITFYKIDYRLFDNFPMGEKYQSLHINSMATYYRLYMTEVLPNSINKVIYLDGDLVVRHSLKSLWNTDIDEFYVAAVPDVFNNNTKHYNRLRYSQSLGYFNAGVLLVNLKKWRQDNILQDFLNYVKLYPSRLAAHDQDVMNYLFREQKVFIDLKYNMQNDFFFKPDYSCLSWEFEKQLKAAQMDPVIVHFTGLFKPWFRECKHPYKFEFDTYLQHTQWRHISKKRKLTCKQTVFRVLKRILIRLSVLNESQDLESLYITPQLLPRE